MPGKKLFASARLPGFLALAALQYFVCEFLVSGSWRGNYSYTQNFISDLALPYCGTEGTVPCSTSSVLMTVSFLVLGGALLLAAGWVRPPGPPPPVGAVFLATAGIGVVLVGLVPSNSNYALHSLGSSLFLIFGGCAALTFGLSAMASRRVPPVLTTALGCLALIGYFAYVNSWPPALGPGGIERVSAYSVILGFVLTMVLARGSRPASGAPRQSEDAEPPTDAPVTAVTGNRPRHRAGRASVTMALLTAALVVATGCTSAPAEAMPVVRDGTLSDDFDGDAGAPPDSRAWSYDLGGGGWGNEEVQTYTDKPENVRLDGDGHLILAAVRNPDGDFTSARLTTRDAFAFTSGRAEARIKVPSGQGIHPAFWLLGADVNEVGWPRSGEIDVIETINDATKGSCALHGPTVNDEDWQLGGSGTASGPLSADFHTYWVQRSPGSITMGFDDQVTCAFSAADLAPENTWVFDKPFYLLLNVAVGGTYPGPAGPQTPSPATMQVDWVRVTQY